MSALVEMLNRVGDGFVGFGFSMLVQASLLIVILLAVDLLIKKRVRAVVRYWLWMILLVKLMLPVSLWSPASLGSFAGGWLEFGKPETEQISAGFEKSEALASTAAEKEVAAKPDLNKKIDASGSGAHSEDWNREFVGLNEAGSDEVTLVSAGSEAVVLSWQGWIFLGWLFVVSLLAVLLVQRVWFVRGLVRQARGANGIIGDSLRYCKKMAGVKRDVEVRVSANATSPAVCGLVRPVVLLAEKFGPGLGAAELRAILLHELVHVRRGDLWVNLVQTVLQIAYFYNPLLWFANARIRGVREQAVDEAVMVAMGEKAETYPETLLNVAKMAFSRPALSLRLIGVVESKGQLRARLKRMVDGPRPKSAKLGVAGFILLVVLGAFLLPMAAGKDKSTDHRIVANNGTLEVVGVSEFRGDDRWWGPDGEELEGEIEVVDLSSSDTKEPGYHVVLKKRGEFEFRIDSVKGSTKRSGIKVVEPEGLIGYRIHVDEKYDKTEIKFAVETGDWKTVLTKNYLKGSTSAKYKGENVLVASSIETKKGTAVSVTDGIGYEVASRLVAVDKSGETHTGTLSTDLLIDFTRQRVFEFDVDPRKIKRFEFQVREYGYYKLKDISLRPRAAGDIENEKVAAGFKKTFDSGVTVELVGVGDGVGEGSEWWKADGEVLDEVLVDKTNVSVGSVPGRKSYYAVGKVTGTSDYEFGSFVKGAKGLGSGAVYKNGKRFENEGLILFNIDGSKRDADIGIGIATGEWRTVGSQTADFSGVYSIENIIWHGPVESGEMTVLNVTHEFLKEDVRVVAVGKNGEEYKGGGSSATKGGARSMQVKFRKSLDDIKEFRLQVRNFEWVTFEGVSLRAGYETDFEVEVEENSREVLSGGLEKKVRGYVERFFKNNYRDITDRETVEWGDVVEHENGVQYIQDKVFTFTEDGEFVSVEDVKEEVEQRKAVQDIEGVKEVDLPVLVGKEAARLYDFDSGEWGSRKNFGNNDRETHAWVREHGMDVLAFEERGRAGVFLFDVALVSVDSFDVTDEEIKSDWNLGQQEPKILSPILLPQDINKPENYIFRTREGGHGVLQFISQTDNAGRIKVRYRLVEGKSEELDEEEEFRELRGYVYGEDGEGVDRAVVAALPMTNDSDYVGRTGKYVLTWSTEWEPEVKDFVLFAQSYDKEFVALKRFDDKTKKLDIQLEPAVDLKGRLVDESGAGIADAKVSLMLVNMDGKTGKGWSDCGFPNNKGYTDAEGFFKIKGLVGSQRYRLIAKAEGFEDAAFKKIDVQNDDLDVGEVRVIER